MVSEERYRLTPVQVTFTPAASYQCGLAWMLNSQSWHGNMAVETYLNRENTSEAGLCKDGRTRYYVVYPNANPEVIVSSCEVLGDKDVLGPGEGGLRCGYGCLERMWRWNWWDGSFRGKGIEKLSPEIAMILNDHGFVYCYSQCANLISQLS